jgi:hypothetical protein
MLEWQGIEFQILKLKLHSCIAYKVLSAGVGGQHGYRLSYAFQRIGPLPYITLTAFQFV